MRLFFEHAQLAITDRRYPIKPRNPERDFILEFTFARLLERAALQDLDSSFSHRNSFYCVHASISRIPSTETEPLHATARKLVAQIPTLVHSRQVET